MRLMPDWTPRQLEAEAAHPAPARGAVEAESLVAGSGNPASSVSSGRVEAEGCGSWKYNEGVGGQYTCAGCGARPFRSAFLIEATYLEGNMCVERDLEGRLYGRCYDCCRGRGRHGGLDIYADLPATDEETLMKKFECNKRHTKRSDVKKNENALLKILKFKDLIHAIEAARPELSKNQRRREVFDFCKKAAQSSVACLKGVAPQPLRGAAEDRPALQGGEAHPGRGG